MISRLGHKHAVDAARPHATAVSIGTDGTEDEADVDRDRRGLIVTGGLFWVLLQSGLLGSVHAQTPQCADLFSATTMDEALAILGSTSANDTVVDVTLPGVVEDGAVVPVTVSSTLDGVSEIYVLVASNPYPAAVCFEIPSGTDPFVSVRLKLAQSGPVYAVVRASGRLYSRVAQTRVTVGGCV
ncbi:thiosulfate oxidation carrier protein SoxY [Thiocapsa rosea]|uniref:Sulfur-oxidizing protein SoxY n=1 Tax=Thiocapsa rosea TaxID=69360 RepID=A0A495VD57_9GAMM|nr:thiosulfate oxidation carrier protein SoxY [Thiocapsa rosea]RKT47269.1 sulfur-oxidizing protein SoxY [Thiocapsa rosea]